jgi:hypothetical protein
MLLVRFTLPITNTEGAQDINYLVANNGLSTVTDELQGCTSLNNVILQGIDKLFVCLDTINISNFSVNSNKNDSSSGTIIEASTSSCRWYTLRAGLGDFNPFLSRVHAGRRACGVVYSNVFLMISVSVQPK